MDNIPIEVFANQVGGHTFELQNQGILRQGRWILKQLQDKGRGDKEVTFYSEIEDAYPEFTQWIAKYHGIKDLDQNGVKGQFIILDDLTYGYMKPSIIDLKIGTTACEEDAPLEKIERESIKYPLQHKIGFRLTGMRVFSDKRDEYQIYDKEYGHSITEDTLNSLFATYFIEVTDICKKEVIASIIEQLKPILVWFETSGHLRFISSSLLFILEGKTISEYKPIVRIVDFAHVKQLPEGERDEGCIIGIQTILHELEVLYASL